MTPLCVKTLIWCFHINGCTFTSVIQSPSFPWKQIEGFAVLNPLTFESQMCELWATKSPSSLSMTRGVPPQITAAPLEARVFPYGDAVTAGETHRNRNRWQHVQTMRTWWWYSFHHNIGCTVFCRQLPFGEAYLVTSSVWRYLLGVIVKNVCDYVHLTVKMHIKHAPLAFDVCLIWSVNCLGSQQKQEIQDYCYF